MRQAVAETVEELKMKPTMINLVEVWVAWAGRCQSQILGCGEGTEGQSWEHATSHSSHLPVPLAKSLFEPWAFLHL